MEIFIIGWKSIRKKIGILGGFFLIILGLTIAASWMMEDIFLAQEFKLNLGIVNEDASENMSDLLDLLLQSEEITEKFYVNEYVSKDELNKAIESNEIIAGVILPEDFLSSVLKGKNYSPEIILTSATGLERELLENFVLTLEHLMDATQSGVYSIFSRARGAGVYNSAMVYEANWNYISHLLSRDKIFYINEIQYIDSVKMLDFYGISFGIFLLVLSSFLFYEELNINKDIHIHRQIYTISNIGIIIYWVKFIYLALIYSMCFLLLIKGLEGDIYLHSYLYAFISACLMLGFQAFLSFRIKDFHISVMGSFLCHVFGLICMGGIIPNIFLPNFIRALAYLSPMYYMRGLLLSSFTIEGGAWGFFIIGTVIVSMLLYLLRNDLIKALRGEK